MSFRIIKKTAVRLINQPHVWSLVLNRKRASIVNQLSSIPVGSIDEPPDCFTKKYPKKSKKFYPRNQTSTHDVYLHATSFNYYADIYPHAA